jgi:putative phosphoesterase
MKMKLMFISDIHGSSTCLEKALECYEVEKADKLIVLGDILYHGPRNPLPDGYEPKLVIEQLNPLKDQILAVRGNCDSEVDQMVLDFPMRGDYREIMLDSYNFFISHGHLYDNSLPTMLTKGAIYIQGHTHIPMLVNKEGIWHINPGSITLPKEGHPKTYAIYEEKCFTIKTMDGNTYMSVEF